MTAKGLLSDLKTKSIIYWMRIGYKETSQKQDQFDHRSSSISSFWSKFLQGKLNVPLFVSESVSDTTLIIEAELLKMLNLMTK